MWGGTPQRAWATCEPQIEPGSLPGSRKGPEVKGEVRRSRLWELYASSRFIFSPATIIAPLARLRSPAQESTPQNQPACEQPQHETRRESEQDVGQSQCGQCAAKSHLEHVCRRVVLLDAEGAELFSDGVGYVHRFFRLFRPLAIDADLDKRAALGRPHVESPSQQDHRLRLGEFQPQVPFSPALVQFSRALVQFEPVNDPARDNVGSRPVGPSAWSASSRLPRNESTRKTRPAA